MIDARDRNIALLVAGCFFMEMLDGIVFATEYAGTTGDWATHIDRVNYSNLAQK